MKQRNQVLGPVDMAFFYVDTPETPMNIGAVAIFDGKIDYDQLKQLVAARIHTAPLYQQRIVQAPLRFGPPVWAFDTDFSVENHVFKMTLDPPGTIGQLRLLAGQLTSGMLDRSKPLWEMYLIDGLEDDRCAIFFKVHHCMVDGIAAVKIITLLMDLTPDVPDLPPPPPYTPPPLPSTPELLFDAFDRFVPDRLDVFRKIAHDAQMIGSVLGDKERRRKLLVGMANLINDNLRPIKKLPINGKNSGKMALAWAEFSLAEVRAIKAHHGASVNDVMLTVLGGAVEAYVARHGGRGGQDFLRALVPVNVRADDEEGQFGNRISVLPVDIPFGIVNPLERLRHTVEYTRLMKQSSLSTGLDLALTLPSLALASVQPLVWGLAPSVFAFLAHTWCTNVAGPQIPVYLLGHKLLHAYGFFPLNPSNGMACVIFSYNQRITMTLVADMAIIPDVTELRADLEQSYEALRKAAKVQPQDALPAVMSKPRPQPIALEPVAVSAPAAPTGETAGAEPAAEVAAAAPQLVSEPRPAPAAASDGAQLAVSGVPRVSANSHSDVLPAVEAAQAAERAPEPTAKPDEPEPVTLFSEPWAQQYMAAINASRAYYNASTRWDAGSLTFVLKPAPRHGYPTERAVWLDLHRGRCRDAHSLPPDEARRRAAFIIEGEYDTWMDVLNGRAQPLPLIMRGKLRLSKGSLMRLMPFTQSAQELIKCAQGIG